MIAIVEMFLQKRDRPGTKIGRLAFPNRESTLLKLRRNIKQFSQSPWLLFIVCQTIVRGLLFSFRRGRNAFGDDTHRAPIRLTDAQRYDTLKSRLKTASPDGLETR
jgi:hypothetical protein